MIYTQLGHNDKYPEKIYTWKLGEAVPDWLSDKAKINFIDGDGNLTLDTHETSSGGFEIINSGGTGTLVTLRSKKDYVCVGVKKEEDIIFPLTQTQLELLYEPLKENKNGRKTNS